MSRLRSQQRRTAQDGGKAANVTIRWHGVSLAVADAAELSRDAKGGEAAAAEAPLVQRHHRQRLLGVGAEVWGNQAAGQRNRNLRAPHERKGG
jgi:hypothetical protein